jgi:hypothetical protein
MAIDVRVEPSGVGAERAIATICAATALTRDRSAPLGHPAAAGVAQSGEEALEHLVASAALALDEIDLHLVVRAQ